MDKRDAEIEVVRSKTPRYGMGYDYYDWRCPTCDGQVAFEPDIEGIPKRCPHCGQLLKKPTAE